MFLSKFEAFAFAVYFPIFYLLIIVRWFGFGAFTSQQESSDNILRHLHIFCAYN